MPTYQYTCTDCGIPLETVQSFTEPALTDCPTCGGRLRKVYSAVGVVFKGSGFYRNDSRVSVNGEGGSKEKAPKGAQDAGTAGSGTKDKTSDSGARDSGAKDSGSKESGTKNGVAANGSAPIKDAAGPASTKGSNPLSTSSGSSKRPSSGSSAA